MLELYVKLKMFKKRCPLLKKSIFFTLKDHFKVMVRVKEIAHSSQVVKGYLVLKFGWSIFSRYENPLLSLTYRPKIFISLVADVFENIWTDLCQVLMKNKYLANIFVFSGPLSENGPFCLETLGH